MLTVETLRKIRNKLREQAENVKYYLFVGEKTGKKFGLKDGQLIDGGATQVIFTKKIKVA